jgi:hypothetical protein
MISLPPSLTHYRAMLRWAVVVAALALALVSGGAAAHRLWNDLVVVRLEPAPRLELPTGLGQVAATLAVLPGAVVAAALAAGLWAMAFARRVVVASSASPTQPKAEEWPETARGPPFW